MVLHGFGIGGDTRQAPRGSSTTTVAEFTAVQRVNAKLQRNNAHPSRAAGAAHSVTQNVSFSSDSDAKTYAKLVSAIQRSRLVLNQQQQRADTWKANLQQLQTQVTSTAWTRVRRLERAELQRRIEDLQARIHKATVELPLRHQACQARAEDLKRLWLSSNGSGRRLHPPKSGWSASIQGGVLADADKPPSRRQHEADAAELLAWTVAHSMDAANSGLLMSNSDVCPRCRQEVMVMDNNQLFCKHCVIYYDATMVVSASMLEAPNKRGSKSSVSASYKSWQHFLQRCKDVEGTWRNVAGVIYRRVCEYMYRFEIPEHDRSNLWIGREILSTVKRDKHCTVKGEDFYNHVHHILSMVSGVLPPRTPPVLKAEIGIMIRMVHREWRHVVCVKDAEQALEDKQRGRTLKNKKRNNPNVGFCYDHLVTLRGHPELTKWNWAIHDPANVREKDAIMEMVFNVFGWKFTHTRVKRLAGHAGSAAARRRVAYDEIVATMDDHDWRAASGPEIDERHPQRTMRVEPGTGVHLCRGANFVAATQTLREQWKDIRLAVIMATYWYTFLSDVNPWRERTSFMESVLKITSRHPDVHFVAEFLRLKRKNDEHIPNHITSSFRKRLRGSKRQRDPDKEGARATNKRQRVDDATLP